MKLKRYCNDLDIKLVFATVKLRDLFIVKDSVLAFSTDKFVCAGCNASYIGETTRHISTRVRPVFGPAKTHTFTNI